MGEVQSIKRACKILDILSESNLPLGVSEISERAGLPKSTVYRILQTLLKCGYVAQNHERYHLGINALRIGEAYKQQSGLGSIANPIMETLWKVTGETVHLVVRNQFRAYYLKKIESTHPVRMFSRVGEPLSLYSTAAGKAMLAYISPKEFEVYKNSTRLLPKTSKTITSWDKLIKELEKIRILGYSVDDMENEEGIRCVGAPIFNLTGNVIGAISISAPAYRFDTIKIQKFGELVKEAANKISENLGYRNNKAIKINNSIGGE